MTEEPTRRRTETGIRKTAAKKASPRAAKRPPKPPTPTEPSPDAQTPPTDQASGEPGGITEHQMRMLHPLIREKVGLTERADVLDYLTTALHRPVTSRKSITQNEASDLIDHLLNAPPLPPRPDQWAALRAPFPPEAIGKLSRSTCRDCSESRYKHCDRHELLTRCPVCKGRHTEAAIHIDYVGHADVTDRLLHVDPLWSWRPFTADDLASVPPPMRNGLWIWLTVLGHTRPGFGDATNQGGGNATKEAIGDALRNAAMRFGVALELWTKGEREWAAAEKQENEPRPDVEPDPGPDRGWQGPSTAQTLANIDLLAQSIGKTRAEVTVNYRRRNGDMPVEALDRLPAQAAYELMQQIDQHITASSQQENPWGGPG